MVKKNEIEDPFAFEDDEEETEQVVEAAPEPVNAELEQLREFKASALAYQRRSRDRGCVREGGVHREARQTLGRVESRRRSDGRGREASRPSTASHPPGPWATPRRSSAPRRAPCPPRPTPAPRWRRSQGPTPPAHRRLAEQGRVVWNNPQQIEGRPRSVNTIEALSNEVQQLEQALAQPDLGSHHRGGDAGASRLHHGQALGPGGLAPYAETSTEDLRTQLEDAELEREELLPLMRAALADRANRPALARKMEREFDDLAQGVAGLRTELDTRQLQDANDVLARHRASVVAEREIRQTDVDALAGLQDDWRRAKAKERLTETFEGRLTKHTGIVHERLLAEADAKVGAQLLLPGHEPTELPESAEDVG